MKFILTPFFLLVAFAIHAQSPADSFVGKGGESGTGLVADKGTWNVGFGWEGGLYFNDVTTNIFGYDTTYSDSAAAIFYPLTVQYCFLNRLSGGLSVKFGKYIEDEDYQNNNTNVVDVFVAYHFLKKERNDLYARLAFGGAGLVIEDSFTDVRGEWRGSHFGLALGYRHYFGRTIGLDVHIGNAQYGLKQESLTAGNTTIDPDDLNWELDLRGFEFGFGLVAKF